MELSSVDVGRLSILPPIIAIGLALITKEVISSPPTLRPRFRP